MRTSIFAAAALAAALPAAAQTVIRTEPRIAMAQSMLSDNDPKRAILGITTSSSGRRDTLGLLVTSVTTGSPAEKAGVEEGSRLQSINGVNLKLSRDDADDDYMQGVNQNRLTREMRKVKAGDEVTLDVYVGGRARSVKVKTVAAEDLNQRRTTTWANTREDERAALGLFLTTTGSKRDTAGVFVQQVVNGGPADKAGIVEGDRIASINGVDLRVPREDAGDWGVSTARADRLEREVRKLTIGQTADLVVVSSGRSRTVKVTAAKASDVPGGYTYTFRSGPGGNMRFLGPQGAGAIKIPPGFLQAMPKIRIRRSAEDFDDRFDMPDFDHRFGDFKFDLDKNFKFDFDKDFKFDFDKDFEFDPEHAMRGKIEDLHMLGPRIRSEIHDNLQRELPRIQDELRDLGPKIRAEIDAAIRDGRIRRYDGERIVLPVKIKDKITLRG